jgi:hypothetical protein
MNASKERCTFPDNLGVYGKREEGIKIRCEQNDLLMQEERIPERSIFPDHEEG